MIVTNATPTNDMEQLAVLNLNIALALYNWLLHMTTLIELAVYSNLIIALFKAMTTALLLTDRSKIVGGLQ